MVRGNPGGRSGLPGPDVAPKITVESMTKAGETGSYEGAFANLGRYLTVHRVSNYEGNAADEPVSTTGSRYGGDFRAAMT